MPSKRNYTENENKPRNEKKKAKNKRKSLRMGIFSKKNDNVATPSAFFEELDEEFCFDCDPCPLYAQFDALDHKFKWGRCNYVNPPYSNISGFVKRAAREWRRRKNASVFLITLRPTTNYWRDYILPNASEVRVLTSRLTFVGYDKPFPAALAVVIIGTPTLFTKGRNEEISKDPSKSVESTGPIIHKRTYSFF